MNDMEIVFGGGAQTLRYVPRDRHGTIVHVSSATYTVEDLRLSDTDADRYVVTSSAATVDPVSTTTTAIAGRGSSDPRTVHLTSVASIVTGRVYMLVDSDGRREPVIVSDVGATFVRTKDEVGGTFASSSSFLGVELTGTFPAAEANDETAFDNGGGPYLATWTYTIDGVTESFRIPFYVVLARETCPATEADLVRAEPLVQSMTGGRTPLSQYLEAAWWTFRAKCRSAGIDLTTVHVGEVGVAAISHWAASKILRSQDYEKYQDIALANENDGNAYFDSLRTGQDPIGVVRVDPANDQAPAGRSEFYKPRFLVK